jgi:ABC-type glycerol-3-phosphate transport system substrate-binding protein
MKKIIIAVLFSFITTGAFASCNVTSGSINILANEFATLRIVMEEAKACAGDGVDFSVTHSVDHQKLQGPALEANPSEFSAKIVTNGSITPLMSKGLLRPLDELVNKYGQALQKSQLITFDGKVYAIAFMANAQHLWYRESIFNELNISVPTTYEEVIAASEKIRASGKMKNPYAAAFKSGWNLSQEFVNMYLGHGGEFFKPGTAEPSINNAKGIAALNVIKQLTELSNPDFLTQDTNAVKEEWESGNVAIMHIWGSGAASLLDDEGDQAIKADTRLAGPPTVGGGNDVATTLWWDGFAIATNTSDENAEASFRALVGAASSIKMAKANPEAAVWLIKGSTPTSASAGVLASAKMGAAPYPSIPQMSLLHGSLSTEMVEFLQGTESAEKALQDVEAAYIAKAKEQGFL